MTENKDDDYSGEIKSEINKNKGRLKRIGEQWRKNKVKSSWVHKVAARGPDVYLHLTVP